MVQNNLKLKDDKLELHEQIQQLNKNFSTFDEELNTACNEIARVNKFFIMMTKR